MHGIRTIFCFFFFFSFTHFLIALQLFSLQLSYLNNVSLLLKTNHALWLRMLLSRRKVLVAQCPTLCNLMECSPPSSSPWNSPDRNTGVSCHSLLQGIFPTQGSNLGLPHCRWILYSLSHHQRIHLKSTFHIWRMGLLGLFLFFKKYFIMLILF